VENESRIRQMLFLCLAYHNDLIMRPDFEEAVDKIIASSAIQQPDSSWWDVIDVASEIKEVVLPLVKHADSSLGHRSERLQQRVEELLLELDIDSSLSAKMLSLIGSRAEMTLPPNAEELLTGELVDATLPPENMESDWTLPPRTGQPFDSEFDTIPPNREVASGAHPSGQVSGGNRIGGRYKVLRAFAKGGLGQVSVAHDAEINRDVALKELQDKFLDNTDLVERFKMEAEITGRLEHPGVVPVYGQGAMGDGNPYYVMRFVRGVEFQEEIDQFHRRFEDGPLEGEKRLQFISLIRHFANVCNTIEYAHSRGIIHRDIKPSNVMLGRYGETFVVDWGLAKPVDSEEEISFGDKPGLLPASGSNVMPTQYGSTVGTPAFMPPEQASGELADVNNQSDVYSLGATFYYLLTGKPPVDGVDLVSIIVSVIDGEIKQPREVAPWVPKPLQAICLKSLSLVPRQRYESPVKLVEDLENWLADEPVGAYPDNFGQRIARWFRRHKAFAFTALAALILLTTVSVVAAMVVNRARVAEAEQKTLAVEATKRAETAAEKNRLLAESEKTAKELAELRRIDAMDNFRKARQVVDTALTGISEIIQYYPGVQRAREGLLRSVAREYEEFAAEQGEDLEIQIERVRAYLRLGEVREALGEFAEAGQAYQNAAKVLEEITKQYVDELDIATLAITTQIKLAGLAEIQGELGNARGIIEQAVLDVRNLAQNSPSEVQVIEVFGNSLFNLAAIVLAEGDYNAAKASGFEALSHYQQQVVSHPENRRLQLGLANTLNLLATIDLETGSITEAYEQFESGYQVMEVLVANEPDRPDYLQSLAMMAVSRGVVQRFRGDAKSEIAAYQEALQAYRRLEIALPDVPSIRQDTALTLADIGQLYLEYYKLKSAREVLLEAQQLYRGLAQQNEGAPRYVEGYAVSTEALARYYYLTGDLQLALELINEAVGLFRQLSEASPEIIQHQFRYALGLAMQAVIEQAGGNADAGTELNRQSVGILSGLFEVSDGIPTYGNSLAHTHVQQGDFLFQQGAAEEAAMHWKRARDIWQSMDLQASSVDIQSRYLEFVVGHPSLNLGDSEEVKSLAVKIELEADKSASFLGTLAVWAEFRGLPEKADSLLAKVESLQLGYTVSPLLVRYIRARQKDAEGDPVEVKREIEQWQQEYSPGNPQVIWLLQRIEQSYSKGPEEK
jgi:eukaryotic-like serine/threonine-protein kinase